ncbi:MAG: hypothetical protein JWR19_1304 [Pedosphaera sp.]|nr:hypothetical protein [Pedosphaera sp.]
MKIPTVPESLKNINIRPLFVMHLAMKPMVVIGDTPGGFRRVGVVMGGSFEGDRLSGQVLDGGNDWQLLRRDGSTLLDVRLNLKTNDEELLTVSYRGIRHGPADVLESIDQGMEVDPSRYYFRINPLFETASKKYNWMNRVLAIGTGHRTSNGPIYSIFEIL